MPVLNVAVYCVPLMSGASGVQRASVPLALTVPGAPVPPLVTVKLVAVTVAGAIGSENVAWIAALRAAPVAPAAGSVDNTLGGVRSDSGPVPESPQLNVAAASTAIWNSVPTQCHSTAGLVMITPLCNGTCPL
jgi:hypothetical protein